MIYKIFQKLPIFFLWLNKKNQIEDLKKELNKEINKNKILKEQIIQLKNELNIEIEKNKKLTENNEYLIEKLKLSTSQAIKEDKSISNTDKEIIKLYRQIDEYKEKLSRYPFELSRGEKLISIILTSTDQKIHYSVICKNTERFIKLEEQLYNDYPEYSDSENYFVVKGNRISKFKTLDENKIKNSDIIILMKNEF